jgi:hypothetical protein
MCRHTEKLSKEFYSNIAEAVEQEYFLYLYLGLDIDKSKLTILRTSTKRKRRDIEETE